jgi:hypothetical protein
MTGASEHALLIVDAMTYVEIVHKALAAENTAPGAEGRVVAAILADAALADYVRHWAEARRVLEASPEPPVMPPIDEFYRRVRDLLLAEDAAAH